MHRRLSNVFGEATVDESHIQWVEMFIEGGTNVVRGHRLTTVA